MKCTPVRMPWVSRHREDQHAYRSEGCQWMPEYGSWMLEGTPKVPLRGLTTHLARVERNMRLRRKRLLATLDDDEIAPTVSFFFFCVLLGGKGGGRRFPSLFSLGFSSLKNERISPCAP